MASGRRLQDQMDSIKSLADHSRTVHVLVGTYDLLALQTLNGQVIRRGITLHCPRYRADVPADVVAFQRVLVSFEQQLPVRQRPDLFALWPYCLERSVGCVGVLKDWLTRALATAPAEDAVTVTRTHLARHALPAAACERLLDEALHGEEQLSERTDIVARLRLRLGSPAAAGETQGQGGQTDLPSPRLPAKVLARRPGERAPRRDPLKRRQLQGTKLRDDADGRTPFPRWPTDLPEFPTCTRLYHLEPLGVGTAWAESLTGYIARLADAHCVRVSTLVAREIGPLVVPSTAWGRPPRCWSTRCTR